MNVARLRSMLLALMFAMMFASPAYAQMGGESGGAAPNALMAGAQSLQFAFPAGGNPYAPGTLGYWFMLTPNLNFGLNAGFALDRNAGEDGGDTITNWDLLLAPALKFYPMTDYVVAPYLFLQGNVRIFSDGIDETEEDTEFSAALGLGVEWFPVMNFSVGGHTGLGVDIVRADPGEPIAIGTFTSGLIASIYF